MSEPETPEARAEEMAAVMWPIPLTEALLDKVERWLAEAWDRGHLAGMVRAIDLATTPMLVVDEIPRPRPVNPYEGSR